MTIPYARQKIWNLKMLEKKLRSKIHRDFTANDAFIIRQVLDLISPNWRDAEDYKQIEIKLEGAK